MNTQLETIVALATPVGKGGVGIVRVSGPLSSEIAQQLIGFVPTPRHATFCQFKSATEILDEGIALYFPAPHSFTGEDVLELQGHGGPVVLDRLINSIIAKNVRLARPGEFSERAFLNNKMDLTQAEAIADLINADSTQAAQSALRSLQGEFSKKINVLVTQLIELRKFIESTIDFSDEEIDFISESKVEQQLLVLLEQLSAVNIAAQQGALLREGMTVVITGAPNAGKSSLLNCLSGRQSAIVTNIAGTTRDILREHIHLGGMPLHVVDTAGLRETTDPIEQEGVRRAKQAIANADMVLLVVDSSQPQYYAEAIMQVRQQVTLNSKIPIILIANKIDLTTDEPGYIMQQGMPIIKISATQQLGIEALTHYLQKHMGYNQQQEGVFIARRRHLVALQKAQAHIQQGLLQLRQQQASELLAEDLRLAQSALCEITGAFTADDLLGEIFSTFCIGK